MSHLHKSLSLTLPALLLVMLGMAFTAAAQSPGDYVTGGTYQITTAYANPVQNPATQNPFCTKGSGCWFTETDVIAASTTSTEIDAWTSIEIGPAIIANGWVAHSAGALDQWFPASGGVPGAWNALTGISVGDGNPTARTLSTPPGFLSYSPLTGGYYYGIAAFNCANNSNTNDYECFDTWFPTYNANNMYTNPFIWDGSPDINQPTTPLGGDPGTSGTVTVTGTNFNNPFQGSGAAGVDPVPCDSRLALSADSLTTNSTTGVQTATLTAAVSANAASGTDCLAIDNHFGASDTVPFDVNKLAATPTFTPAPGTYATAQKVTIADATGGATIYYTTNGTTPSTSSTKYTSAITVSKTTTIKALATAAGYGNSDVTSAEYTINAAVPAFTPVPGTYTAAQKVTLSDATAGATIHYTTNGTTPTASSAIYTSAISVSATATIKAIAIATGYGDSAVASGLYTIK